MGFTARTATTGTGTGSPGVTLTVTKPTGTANGDIIIVSVCSDGNTTGNDWAPSPTTGWTQEAALNPTLDGQHLYVWTRIASSEPASWSFVSLNLASGNDATWAAEAWTGQDAGTPQDAAAVTTTNSSSNTSVVNVALNGITTVTAGSLLIYIAGGDPNTANSGTWGTPSGFTNRVSAYANFAPLKVAEMVQAAAGASGTITGTLTFTGGAAGFAGVMLALRDANPPASALLEDTLHRPALMAILAM